MFFSWFWEKTFWNLAIIFKVEWGQKIKFDLPPFFLKKTLKTEWPELASFDRLGYSFTKQYYKHFIKINSFKTCLVLGVLWFLNFDFLRFKFKVFCRCFDIVLFLFLFLAPQPIWLLFTELGIFSSIFWSHCFKQN